MTQQAVISPESVDAIHYTISEHWLTGPHGRMRYWKSRPAHGLPILLVHGYGALIEHWQRVMRPIAQQHTVYALDLYGLGYSSFLRNVTPSKEIWAHQIATFIENVIQEPAIVVGHSMGGLASAQTAYSFRNLVRALVLVNSTGLPPEYIDVRPTFLDALFFNIVQAPVLGEILATLYTNPGGVRQGLMQAYHRKECVTPELVESFSAPLQRRGAPFSYLAISRAFAKASLNIKPGDVTMPTLLLWGTEDRSMPVSHATSFQRLMFPHATIHLIPNAGHCPFDEAPTEFCEGLLPWLAATLLPPTP